ncbi:unnamed protein product [Adineta ricciae]|uniref:Uncharacterized protein n=1 Tax=Adineta ricciae TaxID=249248 RepID=A0A815CFP0_ADIRI|nr:unnamed protein product [Adineta ricciae]
MQKLEILTCITENQFCFILKVYQKWKNFIENCSSQLKDFRFKCDMIDGEDFRIYSQFTTIEILLTSFVRFNSRIKTKVFGQPLRAILSSSAIQKNDIQVLLHNMAMFMIRSSTVNGGNILLILKASYNEEIDSTDIEISYRGCKEHIVHLTMQRLS